NRDKAAITGIRYTTADDATERELPLPSSGIPLSEMKQAAPEGEKKSGGSGCDAGFLSLAALALVPMAVRSGRRSK
ncbi:MAG: Synerg-CTERM sorting domain-containing protein, partial [Fretibacterium sp.]|nr:Synerg-CTERM sorting domain-containing protein [Fretibacterium sp.]